MTSSSDSADLCPACGAALTQAACRHCGLVLDRAIAGAPVPSDPLPGEVIHAESSLARSADPAALLMSWRRALPPGGKLYLEVPEGLQPGCRLGFTRKSLMLLMERMGFRLITKTRREGAIAGWFRRY